VLKPGDMKLVQRVENLVKAIRAKDIDGVMSLYAPNVVSFDFEVRGLSVTTQGELAFVHSINLVNGTRASGRVSDLSLRWTACFRRVDGIWLIVHDHVSFPADLERGHAFLDLIP